MDDDPLVVPGGEPAGDAIDVRRAQAAVVLLDPIHCLVVKEDERRLQARDHQVLVVSRVGDDGGPVRVPRQILEETSVLDTELRGKASPPSGSVVEHGIGNGPAAVNGIEIDRRRAGVRRVQRLGGLTEPRRQIEREVVVDELAHERGARGVAGRAVGVVGAEQGVDDEVDGTPFESVLRVQDPPRLADVEERRFELGARLRERGEAGEHSPEAVFSKNEPPPGVVGRLGLLRRLKERKRAEARRAPADGAHGSEEFPPAEAAGTSFLTRCHWKSPPARW